MLVASQKLSHHFSMVTSSTFGKRIMLQARLFSTKLTFKHVGRPICNMHRLHCCENFWKQAFLSFLAAAIEGL